jgi:hypothetical protein
MNKFTLIIILLMFMGGGSSKALPLIEATPFCIMDEDHVGFHLIITTNYRYVDKNDVEHFSASRTLWQVMCLRYSGCNGVQLDLEHIEQGKGISFLDLGVMVNVKLVSRTHDVAVFRWGLMRTFVMDMKTKKVIYTESPSPDQLIFLKESYGRGEARCP